MGLRHVNALRKTARSVDYALKAQIPLPEGKANIRMPHQSGERLSRKRPRLWRRRKGTSFCRPIAHC